SKHVVDSQTSVVPLKRKLETIVQIGLDVSIVPERFHRVKSSDHRCHSCRDNAAGPGGAKPPVARDNWPNCDYGHAQTYFPGESQAKRGRTEMKKSGNKQNRNSQNRQQAYGIAGSFLRSGPDALQSRECSDQHSKTEKDPVIADGKS